MRDNPSLQCAYDTLSEVKQTDISNGINETKIHQKIEKSCFDEQMSLLLQYGLT
jgi:hypothetical protein